VLDFDVGKAASIADQSAHGGSSFFLAELALASSRVND
jgi:hypothetical protein